MRSRESEKNAMLRERHGLFLYWCRARTGRSLLLAFFSLALVGGSARAGDPLVPCGDHSGEDHSAHSHYGVDLYDVADPNCSAGGVDFSGARFDDADLRASDLEQMNAACATPGAPSCASFLRTRFENAGLKDADLAGAVLDWATLDGATLDGASFAEAALGSAMLLQTSAVGSHFECADLGFARLDTGDFSNAHFEGADLSFAHLDGATFDAADFGPDALTCSGRAVDLRGAALQGAHLLTAIDLELATVNSLTTYDRDTRFSSAFVTSGKRDLLTFVPEPGSVLAAASALLTLAWMRQRSRPSA